MDYLGILAYKNKQFSFSDKNDYDTYVFLPPEDKPSISQISEWNIEYRKYLCKKEAKKRIASYDWINDSETTPVLLNKEDFYQYRSALRSLIINPVANPIWPEIPQEDWGND